MSEPRKVSHLTPLIRNLLDVMDPGDYLGKAMVIAAVAHSGQKDKAGRSYVMHPLAVAAKFSDDNPAMKSLALLHDVLEDTDLDAELIRHILPWEWVIVLDRLTRNPDLSYQDYLDAVSKSLVAINIKLADLEHNMDILRCVDGEQIKKLASLFAKYRDAHKFLKAAKEESHA